MTKHGLNDPLLSLPNAPSVLCFNKDEFMKPGFNAEMFLVECRRRVPLETLRDDLRIYLKVLQSAMIELINKDYADFVNLSTNLVGLDKAINSLMHPLSQLQQDVLKVKNEMDAAIQAVQEKLRKQAEIRQKKASVARLRSIIHSVEKMENLLGIQSYENYSTQCPSELNGQLIERVATQFNKLQFFVNKSRGQTLVEEIKPRIGNITTTLQYCLEGSFKNGLETDDTAILRQCLRTYATIDKMRDAENLFRQHTVKPYMEEVVNEEYIKEAGLKGMYAAILDFIPQHCKILKEVTSGNIPGGGEVVRGYDFIVNSVWPEVITNIEARVSTIFAPGNPNQFHEKYCDSMEFLEKYEVMCGSQASVKRLRAHPSYNIFFSKWSLPVYFQISAKNGASVFDFRFQEIAGNFESTLALPLNKVKESGKFYLHSSETLWLCLHHCWQPDVFLPALCHRFWKLSLQLLSRYITWLHHLTENNLKKSKPEQMTSSASSASLRNGLTDSLEMEAVGTPEAVLSISDIILLLADTYHLSHNIQVYYEETIKPLLIDINVPDAILKDSLSEVNDSIIKNTAEFESFIIHEITVQCTAQLKNVNDIPRLYRRTNRDKPSKATAYVENLIKPIKTFSEEHNASSLEKKRSEWITSVLESVTQQYLTITADVLTSVKKMEESLKRLKQKKKSENKGLSDDDKIRLQLQLDVIEFGNQIEGMGITKSSITEYNNLLTLVQNANTTT